MGDSLEAFPLFWGIVFDRLTFHYLNFFQTNPVYTGFSYPLHSSDFLLSMFYLPQGEKKKA